MALVPFVSKESNTSNTLPEFINSDTTNFNNLIPGVDVFLPTGTGTDTRYLSAELSSTQLAPITYFNSSFPNPTNWVNFDLLPNLTNLIAFNSRFGIYDPTPPQPGLKNVLFSLTACKNLTNIAAPPSFFLVPGLDKLQSIRFGGDSFFPNQFVENYTFFQNNTSLITIDFGGDSGSPYLTSLNMFTGFNTLCGLRNLNIGYQRFANLPDVFENLLIQLNSNSLSGLQTLDFIKNGDTDTGSLASNITYPVTSTYFTTLTALSGLRNLRFRRSRHRDIILPTFHNLRQLVYTHSPTISSISFSPFNKIASIDLSVCPNLSAQNIDLTGLSALEFLNLYDISFSFTGNQNQIDHFTNILGLSSLSALYYITLNNNKVLKTIDLSPLPYNYGSNIGVHRFFAENCPNLTAVNFYPFTFSNFTNPGGSIVLKNNTKLRTLDISALSGLATIELQGTSLSALSLPIISNLWYLNITSNLLSSLDLTSPPQKKLETFIATSNGPLFFLTLSGLEKLSFIALANSSVIEFNIQSLSALQDIILSNNSIRDFNADFSGLSALKSIEISNCGLLSSFQTLNPLPALTGVQLNNNISLPFTIFNGQSALKTFTSLNSNSRVIEVNNNPVLRNITITDSSGVFSFPLSSYKLEHNLDIRQFSYTGGSTQHLSGFNLVNCPTLTSFSISNANLRNDSFLVNQNQLKVLTLTNCFLSSVNSFNSSPITNLIISSNPLLSSIDSFTNCSNLQEANLNSNSLTSVDTLIKNSTNNLRLLNATTNRINSINESISSVCPSLTSLSVRFNRLDYYSIDYILLTLSAFNTNVYNIGSRTLDYRNNLTGRTRFTNNAYTALTARGWNINLNSTLEQVPFVTRRAIPFIGGTSFPTTLQYQTTALITGSAGYLGTSVPTFLNVLSGNASIAGNVITALSSNGTVTVALCSLDDSIFYPTSALAHITLEKLDISNNISIFNLNRVYTGSTVSASATVVGYPGVNTQLYYYLNNIPATPVNAGFYTVSAVIVDDLYQGTATAELSVLDPTNYYTYPASATSSTIYFNKFCDSNNDIVVSFDYACFGQELTGTEGFCVMFGDNTQFFTPISGGGAGRALGYTYLNLLSVDNGFFSFISNPERYRGVLGIGFDLAGNFGVSGLGIEGFSDRKENSICIRSQYLSSFKPYYRSENLSTSGFSLYQYNPDPIIYPVEYKSVRVRATNFGKQIYVDLKKKEETEYKNYVNATLPTPLPEIVNVGLNFSSGSNNPTFRIKNFNLNCFQRAVTATPFDLFNCFYLGPGVVGGGGITFTTEYSYYFFHSCSVVTGLPASMDLYVDNVFIGNVLYDSSFIGAKFALLNKDATVYETIYGNFLSGANYLYG